MKRFLLVILCLVAFPLAASHIVGGEFEIIHVSGNIYRINLILYFDQLNGNPGAKDPSITARIFRKSDNFVMTNVFLPLASESPVSYTQPECSNGEIVTTKITYSTTITLPADQYNDPGGYYISWERCCRNYTITNVYSQDPNIGGIYAGQTFYLEFPPVVKNGEPFINSSPRLFPPLNDYACPRKLYYVDFAGVDDDGDSLVYSLAEPLNTKSGDALPPGNLPRPRPYPNVLWRAPYSINNVVGGAPDLKISQDGFLTVTPANQGLFVFAVKCEEFRDGQKIGETRRDFQMLVVDVCPAAEPPQILGKKLTDTDFTHDENMNITFNNTVSDDDRCIEVRVSDPDASKQDDNFMEKVKIKAIPLGFRKDVSGILPDITDAVLVNGSTADFKICFDKCPYIDGPFEVGIVAYDDACSLPLSDTLRIYVNIQPPGNSKARFLTANVNQVMNEGDPKITWNIEAVDDDDDFMDLFMIADPGFTLAGSGMEFVVTEQVNGSLKAQFSWDPKCNLYDFTKKTQFKINFLVDDRDLCNFKGPDTLTFDLRIILPPNGDPVISSDLTDEEITNGITKKVFETLEFNVYGKDDNFITLIGEGVDFELNKYNISFPRVEGDKDISSHFRWHIACENGQINLRQKNKFEFRFVVVDNANKCRFFKTDTLRVTVMVEPPDNTGPDLQIVSTDPEVQLSKNHLAVRMGQQISLALSAQDVNIAPQDLVKIEMIGATGNEEPVGYVFEPAEGKGAASTTFTWNPDCSIFKNGVYENDYTFKFRAADNRCFNIMADTMEITMTIKDPESNDKDFLPPNIVTPNGDNLNEFFAMVKQNEFTQELENILPQDNCVGKFVSIIVFNRWGRRIYHSEHRDFRWYPQNEAAGVYFYTLQYSNREYKGTITVHY
ncbi:MAG: gliding motility-associated C-terminal domain-containing protein [Bacteroidota bacterium]